MVEHTCNDCGIVLILGENCTPSAFKRHEYLCRECKNKRNKKYKSARGPEARLRSKIGKSLSNHRRKGIVVEGTVDDYIATYTGKCKFCGEEFDIFSSDLHDTGSLDRIDNGDIMTPDGVQWLCYRCNSMKRDRTNEEFKNYLMNIINNI